MLEVEKRLKYLLILLICICICIVGIFLLYLINLDIIRLTITTVDGALLVLIALIIRICVLACMTTYLFIRWSKQEELYTADLPFLFGMFFLILIFGKLLDILTNFLFPSVSTEVYLFYLKIRQLVVIGTLAPMIFLSIMMIIIFLQASGKIKKYTESKKVNNLSLKILVIIAILEAIIIIITPDTTFAGINFAIFVVSSLLVITWMFYFSYSNNRLSQVNTKMLTIGFGAYLISQIVRPLAQFIIGENALFIVITEIIDIIIGLVIFIGYIKKSNY
jgi:hypothetical protein